MTRVRAGLIVAVLCLILGFFAIKLYDLQILQVDGTVDNTKTYTTYTK